MSDDSQDTTGSGVDNTTASSARTGPGAGIEVVSALEGTLSVELAPADDDSIYEYYLVDEAGNEFPVWPAEVDNYVALLEAFQSIVTDSAGTNLDPDEVSELAD